MNRGTLRRFDLFARQRSHGNAVDTLVWKPGAYRDKVFPLLRDKETVKHLAKFDLRNECMTKGYVVAKLGNVHASVTKLNQSQLETWIKQQHQETVINEVRA